MKKFLRTGKKALSVFMAVMMVMTAWVFFEPMKAEAATAGTYDYAVRIQTTNSVDVGDNKSLTITLDYKKDNGTGSAASTSQNVSYTWAENDNADNTAYFTGVAGFPTKLNVYCLYAWTAAISRKWGCTITVSVKNNNTGNYVQIAQQSFSTSGGSWGQSDMNYAITSFSGTPSITAVKFISGVASITIPKTGASDYSTSYTAGVYDQYGVRMTYDPTYYVRTSAPTSAQSSSNTIDGVSITRAGDMTVESSAQMATGDTKTIYVHAKYGTLYANRAVKLTDPKYTVTFNANGGNTLNPSSYDVYYGETLDSQHTIDSAVTYPTSGSRTGYTWIGMFDKATGGNLMDTSEVVTANKTYYAHWQLNTYNAIFYKRLKSGGSQEVVYVQTGIPYGGDVTEVDLATAKLNSMEADEANHYILNETSPWGTTPTTTNVTGNRTFNSNYTSAPHTFGAAQTVEANCVHGAGTIETCTVCGYEKVTSTGSPDLTKHTKSDSYIVDTEPTCTTAGSGHYFCTTCNATLDTVEIPAKGHTYAITVTKEATCKETGTRELKCTDCNLTTTETIPLTQHNYVKDSTVAATCQHSGYDVMKCSVCGDTYNKYLGNATTNHSWNITSTPSATHGYDIVTGSCSVCGASFTKEVAEGHSFTEYEITKNPTCIDTGTVTISCSDTGCSESYTITIPATSEHVLTTTVTPATCKAEGSIVETCKYCTYSKTTVIPKAQHNYVKVDAESVSANCAHGAYDVMKCSVCNDTYKKYVSDPTKTHDWDITTTKASAHRDGSVTGTCKVCGATFTATVPYDGHDYSVVKTITEPDCIHTGKVTIACSDASCTASYDVEIPATGVHKYEMSYTAPTCTTEGSVKNTCSVCGDTITQTVPKTAHSYTLTRTEDATCQHSSYKVMTCACGDTYNEYIGNATTNHSWTWTIVNATPEKPGTATGKCSVCSATVTAEVPAESGHNYTNVTVTKEPTCKEPGTAGISCADDDDAYIDVTLPIDATAHRAFTTKYTPATCTTDGLVKTVCADCGATIGEEKTIDKTGHYYTSTTTEPTCTQAGVRTYTCQKCSASYTEAIPALGHKEVVVSNDCTRDGYTICPVCNQTLATVKATGHNFVGGEETIVPATCQNTGIKLTKCTRCEVLQAETIAKIDHDYKDIVITPTCTADGYTIHICKMCGESETTDKTVKLGHDWVNEKQITAPKCEVNGVYTHECQRCGEVAEFTKNDALTHSYESKVVAPTCTAKGYTINICSNCGKSFYEDEVAALGHAWADTVTVDKAATCTSEGQQSRHCTRCGAVTDVQTISKTAHDYELKTVAATCTESGYTAYVCKNCDALDQDRDITLIDPTGHTWNDGEILDADKATCEKAAVKTYTCTVCGETKREVEGAPLGHNWGGWFISKPATDTEKGEKKRVCNNDSSHVETCKIPTIGHNWDEVKTVDSTCTVAGYTEYKCTTCENCAAAIKNGGTGATQTVALPLAEHTYITETVDPTCTTAGSTVVKCSVCGHEAQSAVTIPATGHTIVRDVDSDVAPTCDAEGSYAYKCTNTGCDYTETVSRPAIGHNYDANGDGTVTDADATVTKSATCTEKGVLTYTCQNDPSHTYTEEIPTIAHSYVVDADASKTATCTDMGYTVMKCENCDATYVDKDSITPAKGHTWSAWTQIQAPTTDGYGIEKRTCSVCDAEELRTVAPIGDHVFTLESEVKPGCETTGEKVWVCTVHTACPANYTEVVPATGHNDVLTSSTTASCLVDGTETYACANDGCTRTYTLLIAPATGHDYESEVTTEATCETDGVRTYTCKNDATHTYTEVIPKLGHNYKTKVIAPTCSAYGYTTYTCQNDPTHTYQSDFVATTAHTYAKDNAQSVAATCVSKGYDVMVCSGCGDSYKVITDATGHAYDAGVETTPATCTANGVMTYTCSNCGDTYTTVIPALGHDYGEGVVVREANGGNTGLIAYTCKRTDCGGKFYEEYVMNSIEHTWNVDVKQNATCTAPGEAVYTCIKTDCPICAHGVKATFTKQTPALGHDYVGVETTAPTCTETGVMTYTCSRCDSTYDEVIPATGHTYGAGAVTEATCTTAGYTKYTCETCGYEMFDNFVAPLGHQIDSHVVTAPTCTTAGWTTHSCTRTDCGYSYIDTVTEATGHDYESAVTIAPTCESDGVKTYTCKNCAADVDGHSYTETVAKTGHAWGEWVTTKNPTATEEGEKTRTCANDPAHTETVTLPKLGHTMVAGDIKVQPTCTTTGIQEYVCIEHTGDAACGYTYEVTLPALGHDWNDGEITTAATCTTDGEKTYTCKRDGCDATKTEVVPKTGHDMETAVTDATCVSDKFTTYTCKTCGYSYVINETGTALGHTFSVVVESVDATCEAKGYTIYKCERCDQTKTETTEALGHNWGEWKTTTPATCSERGVETRTCKNNPTHIQTRRTNTVDHDFVSTLYHPTCTESGFTILACKGCGKTIRTDFVPAYGHKYDEGVYEDATCTTPGGIRYTCTNINPDGTACKHSYLVKDTEPLGHIWGAWHYVEHPTVADAYAKQRDCTRGSCTAIEYERGKMANEDDINVYYKVEFFNPWTTDTYYELNNGRTKLAKTYKTTKVNEAYYLAGDEVTYPSSIFPKREKDYTWGAYKLIDWTYDEAGQTQSALNDMKSISKNMAVYANFEGYDVYYKVAFWSEGTRLTIDEVILHGHAAQYPFDPPTKKENLQYKYEFTGWDYDYTAIYDSVAICAKYKEIAKSYNIIYCDWNGTELATETFKYGEAAKNNPTNLTKTSDATYIYEFSGKWQTAPGKEEYIDLNHLTVPNSTVEGGTIKVYAKYYQKAKNYTVNIHGYGINNEIIPGATVQIFNSSGQIVTTTKLDANSDVTINLTYDTAYQIMIVDDSGNVGVKDVELNTSLKDENTGMLRPTEVTIYLDKYEDPDHGGSDCHCICHSFLGRLWISMLNMIYRLFGKKIVCCYDMYATHGDQLIYGK